MHLFLFDEQTLLSYDDTSLLLNTQNTQEASYHVEYSSNRHRQGLVSSEATTLDSSEAANSSLRFGLVIRMVVLGRTFLIDVKKIKRRELFSIFLEHLEIFFQELVTFLFQILPIPQVKFSTFLTFVYELVFGGREDSG